MRYIYFAFLLAIFAAATPPALAQDASARFVERPLPDEAVDQVLAAVAANISQAHGDDDQPLPPLSAEEQSHPLLDRDLVREVFDVGIASGVGQACGLDWRGENFVPLMHRERARGDRTPHQLAAIAMIHGLIQGQVAARGGTCGANGAAAAQAFYQRKWGAPSPAPAH
jgi:hypothetical protein